MKLPLPFRHSLQLRLAAALIAGGFSFYDSYRSTHKLQDDLLRQIAAHIDPQRLPENTESQRDAHIRIQTPAGEQARAHHQDKDDEHITLPPNLPEGLHTFQEPGDSDTYRAYIRHTPQGPIAVLQENEFREDMAEHAAWSSALPLLLLAPLSILLTILIVQRTMQPVRRLSQSLDTRPSADLTPLPEAGQPHEIRGFIRAINHLLARTEAAMQQQQRFIADAAHELRSPMTALSLQAERLAAQPLPEPAAGQLATLLQGIRRNRHLLEQLLSLTRAQAPEAQRPKALLSSQALFRSVIEDLHPLAEAKQQDLGVASPADPIFHANQAELYTLVKTLTDNAIRYTPAGSQIDLSAAETPGHIILRIEDNGSGIPPAERSRVFDPFYRILGSGQEGTGLGLSIARTIAERHGGRIELSNSPRFPSGLLVSVYLSKSHLG
ncbi:two-component sensor histidine kinase [Eikenella longinqua]|uniref:histidine kinase n=1 Tax=Eikenella longinqua TaxID=1795827 RepID=A0A1A9S1N0_9NEIS|nr:ATP-binding protein [Eikenella longinqua]OAM30854.1 two-component sensor histidine kinase [Eikenella longinqua]